MKKSILILSAVVMTAMMLSFSISKSRILNKIDPPKEIIIGTQVWMKENLNVDKFRNGDLIPEAKTKEEWEQAGKNRQPAWCYHDNDPANGKKYGKLYNWYAVNDVRGLAPEGWHVPSDDEWNVLIDFLGGKDKAAWRIATIGSNDSGFSGPRGGGEPRTI